MLSKLLYELCLLLSTPYNDLNTISYDTNSLDSSVIEKIYLKKLFDFKWRKKMNSSFKNFNFDYHYVLMEQNNNLLKIKLNLTIFFKIKNYTLYIPAACIHEYIVISEHIRNEFKIRFLVENEENPILFDEAINTPLSSMPNFIFPCDSNEYADKLYTIDSLFEFHMTSGLLFNEENNQRDYLSSNFNVDDACTYAETYALNSNPDYKSFEGIGGDCTNFMSQILNAGGIQKNHTWKPYTHSWIRVEEFYQYLTSRKLGSKLPNDSFLDRGCLIQFYTPAIGRFFHNGFITYKLENNDCLYCCHSYNKLNYPLSEIYPNRYPKLRALKFN